jgi:hypothetical protein
MGDLETRIRFPTGARGFLLSLAPIRPLECTLPLIKRIPEVVSPEEEQHSREADCSHQSDANVRNGGAVPLFSIHLCVVAQVN